MAAGTIDTLKFAQQLEKAGFTRQQAEAQASIFSEFSALQEERAQKELATKADLRELELRLQYQIEQSKNSLLKWQIGIAIVVLTIMAKGFGWLGF